MEFHSIWDPFIGKVVHIEQTNGNRFAALVERVLVHDGLGDSIAQLRRTIRVVDSNWNGPIDGEFLWYGSRVMRASVVSDLGEASEVWGEKFELPKTRAEVVKLLEKK